MAKRKLKMLLTLGLDDQEHYGIADGADGPPREDEVIAVDEKEAKILLNVLQCATDYVASEGEEEAVEEAEVSPVNEYNAADAIQVIGTLDDKVELQQIIDLEGRTTVVAAAKGRLAELQ